jgi:superfamily II DNA or RNA helicase
MTIGYKIDRHGYHIKKKNLEKKEIENLKKELTVSPVNNMYGGEEVFYEQYVETEKEIIIPRYFGIKNYGEPKKYNFEPQEAKIPFITKLRDYQEPIVAKCVEHILQFGGGHLSVPCGRGKTVMAIYIAHKLGLKTLVITHQSFLQDQWIDRIKFFTGEKAGIIRQDEVKVDGKNIVVGMIHSIASRDYGDIFDDFGLIICDECHHYASKWFSNTISKLGGKYTLGLSATLYRNDGLVKVVHWYLGEVAYKEKIKTNNQVVVKMLNFSSKHKKFKETTKMVKGIRLPNCSKMLNNLVENKDRNTILINVINELRQQPGRKILVLSGRKSSHLPKLKNEIDNLIKADLDSGKLLQGECNTYYYTGDCKRSEREEAEKNADIIFGTFNMAQEGLDIPRLNTVIFATPKKDIVQAVGRILRKELQNGDIRPLIVDIVDNLNIFTKQGNVREKFYDQSDYKVDYFYFLDKNPISPKQYIELKKEESENICDKAPKDFKEILQVEPVEFIFDDITSSDSSSKSSNSIKKKKKQKFTKHEDIEVEDVFDL